MLVLIIWYSLLLLFSNSSMVLLWHISGFVLCFFDVNYMWLIVVIRSSSKALIAMSVGGCWFQIELLLINIIVFLSSVAYIKSGGWLSCWHICKRASETAHEYHRIKHRFRCWIFVCFMVEWSRIPLVACLVLYVANRQKFMHESKFGQDELFFRVVAKLIWLLLLSTKGIRGLFIC